jgi:hypothetical protein
MSAPLVDRRLVQVDNENKPPVVAQDGPLASFVVGSAILVVNREARRHAVPVARISRLVCKGKLRRPVHI